MKRVPLPGCFPPRWCRRGSARCASRWQAPAPCPPASASATCPRRRSARICAGGSLRGCRCPVSATSMRTVSDPSGAQSTRTSPFSVYFRALSIRFTSTCSSRYASAVIVGSAAGMPSTSAISCVSARWAKMPVTSRIETLQVHLLRGGLGAARLQPEKHEKVLTMAVIRSALRRMVSTQRAASPSSAPSSISREPDDGGQRRAQLVGGVDDKVPLHRLQPPQVGGSLSTTMSSSRSSHVLHGAEDGFPAARLPPTGAARDARLLHELGEPRSADHLPEGSSLPPACSAPDCRIPCWANDLRSAVREAACLLNGGKNAVLPAWR